MTGEQTPNRRAAVSWLGGGLVAAAALAVPTTAQAAEKEKEKQKGEIDLKNVPKVVMVAAVNLMPQGTTWLAAIKHEEGEGKDKKVAYELDGTDGKDRKVTVTVTEAGDVVEEETVMKDPANVPKKVMDAVTTRWKNFTASEAHLIRQGKSLKKLSDGDHVYDLRGTVGKKGDKEFHVQVEDDGTILEYTVEVDEDKVPKEVTDALTKAHPKFKIGTAYKLVEGKEVIGYHFESKGSRHRTISVSPDGKQVESVGSDK